MAEHTSLIENIEEQLENITSEPKEVQELALQSLQNLDFPTRKDEEWKYTEVRSLLEDSFEIAPKSVLSTEKISEQLPDFEIENANILVFVNGYFSAENSKIQDANLEVKHLQEIEANDPIFAQEIGKIADSKGEAFTALNTAMLENGLFIKVPRNQAIENPVLLHFVADGSEKSAFVQPRNFIHAEQGSQATIIEFFTNIGENQTFTNTITEVKVESNAFLDHYKIQLEGSESSHIGTTSVHQSRDSKFSDTTISLDGKKIRNNLNINLDGENCEAYMNGLYMPFGSTHVDNHTTVDHMKPHSYSDEMYKGILGDTGTAVFNGKIFVRQYAQKTNAFQSNKNIALSPQATVNTKPQLEIWADDVKCSHGCTTGALDEEPMFYLRSRGIPEEDARKLLLFAFADDVLDRIKVEAIRNFIEKLIHAKLDSYGK